MPRPPRQLRSVDLRFAFTLVGECIEQGADPILWRGHLLRRLQKRMGAAFAMTGQSQPAADGAMPRRDAVEVGWDDGLDREPYERFLQNGMVMQDPLSQGLSPTMRAYRREDFMADEAWYASPVYNEHYRPSGLDRTVTATQLQAAVHGPGMWVATMARRTGEPGFSPRDVRLMRYLGRVLTSRAVASRLASYDQPSPTTLAPRVREVLVCVLEGKTERQAAMKLELSPHTVREYCKTINRHLSVEHRGELVARYGNVASWLARQTKQATTAAGDAVLLPS